MELIDFIFNSSLVSDGENDCLLVGKTKIKLPANYAQNSGMDPIDPKDHINVYKPIENKEDK